MNAHALQFTGPVDHDISGADPEISVKGPVLPLPLLPPPPFPLLPLVVGRLIPARESRERCKIC